MSHPHEQTIRPRSWVGTRVVVATLGAFVLVESTSMRANAQANVVPPHVMQHVDAQYPASAVSERKHADVILTLTVDADGHVSSVTVAQSGGEDLDEAAVVAARQWTFTPATRDGAPVASRIRVPFHFAPPAPAPELVETAKPDELATQPATQAQVPTAARVPPSKSPSPPADDLEEVTEPGRLEPPATGGTFYRVPIGQLALVPRTNASDALKLAPGFLLTNEGGSGHAEQVFLRGFDAHEGQDLEFTVDGVPI